MPRSGRPPGAPTLPVLAFLALCILAACGPDLPTEPLEDIPQPDLTTSEDSVRRQLDDARAEMESLLADDSASWAEQAAAVGRLASFYQAYDLLDAAAAAYRNTERLDPDEPRWPYLLGVIYRWEGELEAAAVSLRRALELDGEPATQQATRLQLAEVELDLGRVERAEELARQVVDSEAVEGDASAGAAHHVLGKAAESRDDLRSAIEHYAAALELQPQADRLHYLLGQAQRRAGDLDAAREHLRQAGQTGVAFGDPRLASIYTDIEGSAALMQRGASAKSAGMLDASVEIYRRAVANDPQSPEARRDLGALLAQTGRYRESADQYREAVRLEPDKALNHFVLALVLEQLGEPKANDDALESFERAVELAPDYREFRRALADRLAQVGRFADAMPHFERLVNDDPGDVVARLERAKVRVASGEEDGALDDARRVAEEADRPALKAEALTVAGEALSRRADGAGAVQAYRQALEIEPDSAGAHFGLANLLGVAGRFDEAAASYRRAIESDPTRVAAWLGEATALALSGREAEAVRRLDEGRAAFNESGLGEPPPLTFTLARLLLGAQDPALRDPERAARLARGLLARQGTPEHGELLAVALAETGRFDEAIRLQQRLLDGMPSGADPQLEARWRAQLDRWRQLQTVR